jgi:hypothetical protein
MFAYWHSMPLRCARAIDVVRTLHFSPAAIRSTSIAMPMTISLNQRRRLRLLPLLLRRLRLLCRSAGAWPEPETDLSGSTEVTPRARTPGRSTGRPARNRAR